MVSEPDKKRVLFDAISQDYDVGNYDEFVGKLSDENKRRTLFDAVSEEYELGTWDEFNSKLGYASQPQTEEQPKQQQPKVTTQSAAQPTQPVQQQRTDTPYIAMDEPMAVDEVPEQYRAKYATLSPAEQRVVSKAMRKKEQMSTPEGRQKAAQDKRTVAGNLDNKNPKKKQLLEEAEALEYADKPLLNADQMAKLNEEDNNIPKTVEVGNTGMTVDNPEVTRRKKEKQRMKDEQYLAIDGKVLEMGGKTSGYTKGEDIVGTATKVYDNTDDGKIMTAKIENAIQLDQQDFMGIAAKSEDKDIAAVAQFYQKYSALEQEGNAIGALSQRLTEMGKTLDPTNEAAVNAYNAEVAKAQKRYDAYTKEFEEYKRLQESGAVDKYNEAFSQYLYDGESATRPLLQEKNDAINAMFGDWIDRKSIPLKKKVAKDFTDKLVSEYMAKRKELEEGGNYIPGYMLNSPMGSPLGMSGRTTNSSASATAEQYIKKAQDLINNDRQSIYANSLVKGAADVVTDMDFWTFGMNEAVRGYISLDIMKKVQRGADQLNEEERKAYDAAVEKERNKQPLTPEEEAAMEKAAALGRENLTDDEKLAYDAMQNYWQVQQLFTTSNWYMAGQTTAEAIPFIVAMWGSGGILDAIKGGARGAEKVAMRQLGKQAAKRAEKLTFKEAVREAGRATVNVGKAVGNMAAEGAVYATTTGLPHTVAGTMEYLMPESKAYYDTEDGTLKVQGVMESKESVASAIGKAWYDQFVEGMSEALSTYGLEPLQAAAYARLAGSTATKLGKEGNRAYRDIVRMAFKRGSTGDAMFRNISSFPNEYIEELFGGFMRCIGGTSEWDKEFSGETLAQTAYGLLPMQIVFSGMGAANMRKHNKRMREAQNFMNEYAPDKKDLYDRLSRMSTYEGQDLLDREILSIQQEIDALKAAGKFDANAQKRVAAEMNMVLVMKEQLYMDEYAATIKDERSRSAFEVATSNLNEDTGDLITVEYTDNEGNTKQGYLISQDGEDMVVSDGKKNYKRKASDVNVTGQYTQEQIEDIVIGGEIESEVEPIAQGAPNAIAGEDYTDMDGNTLVFEGSGTLHVDKVDENGDVTFTIDGRQTTVSRRQFREMVQQSRNNMDYARADVKTSTEVGSGMERLAANVDDSAVSSELGRAGRNARADLAEAVGEERTQQFENMDEEELARAYAQADADTKLLMQDWMKLGGRNNHAAYHEQINERINAANNATHKMMAQFVRDTASNRAKKDFSRQDTVTMGTLDDGTKVVVGANQGGQATVMDMAGNRQLIPSSRLTETHPMSAMSVARATNQGFADQMMALERAFNGTAFQVDTEHTIGVDDNGKEDKAVVVGITNRLMEDGSVVPYVAYATEYAPNDEGGFKIANRSVNEVTADEFRDMVEGAQRKQRGQQDQQQMQAEADANQGRLTEGQEVTVMVNGKPMVGQYVNNVGHHLVVDSEGKTHEFKSIDELKESMQQAKVAMASVQDQQRKAEVAEQDELEKEYQARFEQAKTEEERAQVIQEYLDQIKTDDFVMLTATNLEEQLKGFLSDSQIASVRKKYEQAVIDREHMGGFHVNGKIFMFANGITNINHARSTYVHERQHGITENNVSLLNEIMSNATREELAQYVRTLCGSNAYSKESARTLADEFISMSMELMYMDENAAEIMRNAGIKEELINTIIQLDNEQRTSDSLAAARRGQGRNLHESNDGQRGGRPDGSNQGREPGDVGGEGLRPARGGSQEAGQTTEDNGVRPSITADDRDNAIRSLNYNGIAATEDETRFSVRYVPSAEEAEKAAVEIAAATGVDIEEARRWVASETSLAPIILDEYNSEYLDYLADDRYSAIKKDSDYPQGTVDFNNICRKRVVFTSMYQRLQKQFPYRVITGEDLATIRNIMKGHGLEVACGLCYVEDRRQLLGEIANGFINGIEDKFKSYAKGSTTKKSNAKKFLELLGDDVKEDLSIYDLITLDGSTKLYREHPGIYAAFQAYNNARGQQSGNLFQGYSEYKREILDWSDKKVKSVNDNGGLRIFSYSDFEAHHLIDLVQIIQDCARRGVKIQGYTKVPAFARAIAATGVKLNRSLIPLGDTGIVDGKLAYDPIEGIDINDPNFLPSNDNIGNILIGINDEQIRLAMADPFIHFIIPYHSNQSNVLRRMKQTGAWTNYKNEQTEKGENVGKHGVNIYTDVLNAAEAEGNPIQNERQFVEKFLAVCKEKGWTPRFARFLDQDENGNYVYTPGYYKFLVDFKLFDEQGNILPQQPVQAVFDDEFNAQILNDYVEGKKGADMTSQLDVVYDEIVDALGMEERKDDVQYSVTESSSEGEQAEEQVSYSVVTDPQLKERLEQEPKVKVYRAMQMRDGKLYPPMAGKVNGEWQNPIELGVWEQADEHPELVDNNGRFKLDKGNGTSISAAYNPYLHTSRSPLNDQFSSAWNRPELVTVEVEVPESELTSGYMADKAKDAVGEVEWKSGPVSGKLAKLGNPRRVILSRYDKPVRVVPNEEVAQRIAEMLQDTDLEIPFNTVTPELRQALEEQGVKIGAPQKGNAGDASMDAYNEWKNGGTLYSIVTPQQDADYMDAVNRGDMETAQRMVMEAAKAAMPNTKVVDENGNPMVVYHRTPNEFNEFDRERIGSNTDVGAFGEGFYFSPNDNYRLYGGNKMALFINATNPLMLDDNNAYEEKRKYMPDDVTFGAEESRKMSEGLQEDGYDGVVYNDGYGTIEVVAFQPNQIKSADPVTYDDQGNVIPLSERFNPNNDDIRFSFIGERGAARADVKEGAMTRINSLEDARKLEQLLGTDEEAARKIKLATGWERGKDGKWRYEIPDNEYKYHPNADRRFFEEHPFSQEYEELYLKGARRTDEEEKRFNEMKEEMAKAYDEFKAQQGDITLDDIVSHEELFRAYPRLRGIKVVYKDMENGYWGNYDEAKNEISLNTKANAAKQKSTLIHEIQHIIQRIEGFARGGNPETAAQIVKEMGEKEKIWGYKLSLDEAAEQHPEHADDADALLNDILGGMTEEEAINQGWIPEENLRKVGFKVYQGKYKGDSYEKAYKQWYDKLREAGRTNYFEGTPFELYQRLAGEVEARNTQARMGMTYAERLEQLAKDTEDVAREDQLIMLAGDPVLYSVTANEDADMGKPSLKEITTEYLLTLAEQNQEDLWARADAIKAYGDLLDETLREIQESVRMTAKQRAERYLYGQLLNIRERKDAAILQAEKELQDIMADMGVDFEEEIGRGDKAKMIAAVNKLAKLSDKGRKDLIKAIEKFDKDTAKILEQYERESKEAREQYTEKAMQEQEKYDKAKAQRVMRMAQMMMRHFSMDTLTRGEVNRLMSALKNATGGNVMAQAEKVIDILVDHQLKAEEALWNKQLKTKGVKLNDSRVRTQGALGIQAQQILAAVNEGIKLSDKAFDDMFADVESQLDDLTDSRKRREAEAKYQGLLIAKKFLDDIRDSKENVAEAKKKMRERLEEIYNFDDEGNRTLKPEFKGHLDEEHKAKKKEVIQFEKEQLRTIREEKMRRADNFAILNAMLGGAIRDGRIEAKEFLERRLQRINDIHHNANSDQLGQNDEEHYEHTPWEKFKGNALFTFAFSPQRNFDEMLRFFAPLSVDGRGYLHRRFMSQYSHARDTEWRGLQRDNKILDAKAKEILGDKKVSKWRNLYAVERRMPKIEVAFYDGTEKDEEGNTVRKKKNHALTQGQALYIYMTNKQSAGAARLRAMGISEEDVQRIVEQIDPRFLELGDWIQDEFLPQLRERYNEVHERVFGTPLAKNENYFPLRTNAKSRNRKVDLGNENLNDVPSTVTGAIIERQNTIAALDLTHADAFSIVIEHIQEMEHWAAFAEFNSDLQALLNYKRFRTRVENMSSVRFGYGEELFKRFEETAKIAAGTFKPKRDDNNKAAVNVAKGMTASKINFRFYTALKQMSSHPAFWADANITELAKLGFNPAGVVTSVKWAMKELPGFAKRWESRQAGNEMLDESKDDWAIWRSNVLQGVSRVGMFSNAGMDAITVAIGAKAVYETKFSQYKKQGYDEAKAKEMALQDASMVYNESQQSNDAAYLSAMQSQRDWLNSGLAMFRNASFGYGRRYYRAITQLKKGIVYLANDEKKKQAIEYATKMGVREGLTEQQAYAAAKKAVNNMALKNLWDVAIYGYIVQFFWNLMPYIPYLVGGDDDDKKEEMLKNIALHSLAGPIEGMPLGNIVSSAFDNYLWHGKDWASYDYNLIPLIADINRVRKAFKNDELAAANDVLNIIIASGIGFDIKGITDGFIAVMDAVNGDPETTIETALLLMRIAEVPQSQLDQLYIDEVGLTGAEASRMPLDALARRLAHYKMKKNNPLLWRLYSDEKREQVEQKYIKRIMKEMESRINSIDDEELENFFNEETDPDIKKMIGKRVAEEYGVKDDESKKPSKTESEESAKSKIVYQKKRTIDDARQDFAIRRARQEAEEAGDTERYKAIDKEWRAIQKLRKDLNGSESDEAVLEQMREAKKAVIEYYNITTQQ